MMALQAFLHPRKEVDLDLLILERARAEYAKLEYPKKRYESHLVACAFGQLLQPGDYTQRRVGQTTGT